MPPRADLGCPPLARGFLLSLLGLCGLDNCVEGVECGVEKGWFDLSGVELKLTEAGAKEMK